MMKRERLPATYANFVILNGAVIVPTYNQPSKDEQAMRIIGEAFPATTSSVLMPRRWFVSMVHSIA